MKFEVYRSRGGRRRWSRTPREGHLSCDALPSASGSEAAEWIVTIRIELAVAGGRATQVAVSLPSAGCGDLLLALLCQDERAFEEALAAARRDLCERREDEAEQAAEEASIEARARSRERRAAVAAARSEAGATAVGKRSRRRPA